MISTFPVKTTTTGTKERDDEREYGAERICASALDAASSLALAPHSSQALGEAAGSAARGRRGALCVSENVALIGGSVAVMRYQPPTNKRINAKEVEVKQRRDEGSEKERGERGSPLPNPRGEAGNSGFLADTMLRLNIRCLNNQARGDSEERRKGEGS